MRDFGSAVVLAGGKSSRMGFDKSTMVLQNKKLIESTIKKLDSLFDDIIISLSLKTVLINSVFISIKTSLILFLILFA